MAITAIVGLVVTAAVTAYAAHEQSQQQQAIAKFNQKVAENAATAQRNAAQIAAENERDRNRAILAAQRAGIGASGVLGSEGTPLLVQVDSAEKAALNEARIKYSGEVGARQYESEKIIQGYYGRIARTNEQIGYVRAGASLLSGAANAYAGRTTTTSGDAGYSTSAGYQSYRAGERQKY